MEYYFEVRQTLRIVAYDMDNPKLPLEKQDYLGEIILDLGDVASCGGRVTRSLVNQRTKKKPGTITINMTEVRDSSQSAVLRFAAKNLDKKDLFGKSDGFIRISKPADLSLSSWVAVHQTEVKMNTLNPTWDVFTLPLAKLCNNDVNLPLLFQCYDWNRSGKEDFIGEFRASFVQLSQKPEWDLINPAKSGKRGYRNSGTVLVLRIQQEKMYSFLEYIQGGTQINMMVAIDFTGSNGNPQAPDSLHYRGKGPTEYAQAIQAVGNIVGAYDADKRFPVYGFGAKIPPNGTVSHCFPLTFQANPEVQGIEGILSAYNDALSKVTLHGPTNFAEFLKVAATIAQDYAAQGGRQYLILLILTDGEITDMDATVAQIVRASSLPLSIIIVGVGKADFSKMDILDADDTPLQSGGVKMEADIVQFVPFRKYAQDPSALAREVLREVPGQLTSWMKRRNIIPQAAQYRPMAGQTSAQYGIVPAGGIRAAPVQLMHQQQQPVYGSQGPAPPAGMYGVPAYGGGGPQQPMYGVPAAQVMATAPAAEAPVNHYALPAAGGPASQPMQQGAPVNHYALPAAGGPAQQWGQQPQQQYQPQPQYGAGPGGPPGRAPPPLGPPPGLPKARAVQAYAATSATEVSFAAGEVVTVHRKDASGWSEIEVNGRRGWGPSNYLQDI